MKRTFSLLLALVLALSLAACGGVPSEEPAKEPVRETAAQNDSGEETLSPREQFAQTQQAMEELNEEKEAKENAAKENKQAAEYTTNGITYTLDTSFECLTEEEDNFQHRYYNGTMYVTEEIQNNTFGFTTSQELAEYRAENQEGYTVGSANGVYYVEKASLGAIVAFYVDDSGSYWMISATCSDFEANRDQMIAFCTSGKLN